MSRIPAISGAHADAARLSMAILLSNVEEAQRLASVLDGVRRADGPLEVIAVPPVRGLAFFADAQRQDKLDRWWSHAIPGDSQPLYLLRHQAGVAEWLPGLDGSFVVGVAEAADADAYAGMANVTVARGDRPLDIALATVELLRESAIFRDDAATAVRARLDRTPPRQPQRFRRARLQPADEAFLSRSAISSPPSHHPIPNSPAPTPPPPPTPARVPQQVATSDDLVRALADTLHHLQRIRSGA